MVAPVAPAQTADTKTELGKTGAMLTVDIGSTHTRVLLIDRVEGQYRLIARAQTLTTSAPPVGDVAVGVRRALQTITEQTGQNFVTTSGQIMLGLPGGVETLMATASGARPMKVVMVGLTPDVSIASGRRSLAGIYVELLDTITVQDIRTEEEQINAILRGAPDLIYIVGGTNSGANAVMEQLLKTVRLAVILAQQKPAVLYAGNEALKPMVKWLFEDESSVYMVDNVRPDLYTETLLPSQIELGLLYGGYLASRIGGFQEIASLNAFENVLPTVQGYTNMVRYLGDTAAGGAGVLCVDVGSSTVTVTASVNKQLHVTIRPDLGLGHNAVASVKAIGAANIQRWLSFKATENDIMNYAWNKRLRPSTVPQNAQDLEYEYAIARELIRSALSTSRAAWRGVPRGQSLPAMRPIIGAGAILAQAINPGIGALLLLDALQPVGVADLRLDPYGIIPALGCIAYVEPLAVVHVLETGGLTNLATAICPEGRTTASTVMEVTVRFAGGRTQKVSVPNGTLKRVPLPPGQKAQVSVSCARGLHIDGKPRTSLTVEGSAAGLIFDGRGRPIIVPKDLERRASLLPKWYSAVQGEG